VCHCVYRRCPEWQTRDGPPVCDLPWSALRTLFALVSRAPACVFSTRNQSIILSIWRALVAQPHVLLGCTGCARAVMSIGHTPPARKWARILGAGAGYWPSSPHLRKLIEAKYRYLPAKVQLVGNVKGGARAVTYLLRERRRRGAKASRLRRACVAPPARSGRRARAPRDSNGRAKTFGGGGGARTHFGSRQLGFPESGAVLAACQSAAHDEEQKAVAWRDDRREVQ
jgi:hypothetical protein